MSAAAAPGKYPAHDKIGPLPNDPPAPELSWADTRLVSECLSGNDRAWAALVDKYKNLIYSVAIRWGFSAPDAGDIFQSVVADLLSELGRLREPAALPAWLIQVTSRRCQRRQRELLRESGFEEENAALACAEPSTPEALLHEAMREQTLRQALYSASPRCRELLRMLFFESPTRPYADVAKSLGLPVGSIGFNRRTCLERLRKFLEEAGFASS
jgi:RNA polymerase sigma factor (sigma-70 family)